MKAFAVLSLTLVIFAALESSASARGPRWHELEGYSFERYVQDFQRTYANDEEHQARKSLFEARLAEVASHNANPGFTWKKGVNQFTDRTESEIRAMLGYISYFGQNQTCQITNGSQIVPFANISGHVKLDTNSYESLMQAISSVGPVAVSVEAYTWASYESGVFDGCNKTNPDLDHAVQLVGYGTDPELGDYWLIRNSWSPAWGENGYIRIKKQGANASCGMDLNPQDGSACKNETSPIKVCGTCGILYDNSYPLL